MISHDRCPIQPVNNNTARSWNAYLTLPNEAPSG
jgi:hypothetical protein